MDRLNDNLTYGMSLNILKTIGGDMSVHYNTVDEIWDAIYKIYGTEITGGQAVIEDLILEFTENGNHVFNDITITGYKPVDITVNVDTDSYFESGEQTQKDKLTDIFIVEDGVYEREDGYNKVVVDVIPDLDFTGYDYTQNEETYLNNSIVERQKLLDGVEYGRQIAENWNAGNTELMYSFNKELVYFPQIDTSNVEDTLFEYAINLKYVPSLDLSKVDGLNRIFQECSSLKKVSQLNIANSKSLRYAFYRCNQLESVELINTSKVIDMYDAFYNCFSLKELPLFDTSNVTDMREAFYNCSSLTSIPQFDTSKVTDMYGLFKGCKSLITIPLLDTSNVTEMQTIFEYCSSLTSIPLLDTSKITDMISMFKGCKSLTTIPLLDTSNVTRTAAMFCDCSSLTSIPQLDTSKVTDMGGMFDGCTSLTTIPQLNTSKVTDMGAAFTDCHSLISLPLLDTSNLEEDNLGVIISSDSLVDFGGFKNYGKNENVDDLRLWLCPKLSEQSLKNVVNNLYNRNNAGLTYGSLIISPAQRILLGDSYISKAVNKGWNVYAV